VNSITIETSNSEKVKAIKVFDVLGKQLMNQVVNGVERIDLNISELEKGMYYMEITTFLICRSYLY
jgi:hypothetical protein